MTTNGVLPPLFIVGGTWFQAQRRAWSQAASKAGVTNFGYLFTQPQPAPNLGGKNKRSYLPLGFTALAHAHRVYKCITVPKFRSYTVLQTTPLQRRRHLVMSCSITGFRLPRAWTPMMGMETNVLFLISLSFCFLNIN